MTRHFLVRGLSFRVSYDSKKFESKLAFLGPYETLRSGGAVLEIKKSSKSIVPAKALRVHYNAKRGTSEYVLGSSRFYLSAGLQVSSDRKDARFTINYKKADKVTLWHFERALGWVIKTLGLKKNKIYLPGQPLYFEKRLILVTGHPECGKTDFLRELKKQGASLAARNLFLESGKPVFFNAAFAAKQADAQEMESDFMPEGIAGARRLGGVLFVTQWNEQRSAISQIPAEEAACKLQDLSRRAYEYFSPEQSEELVRKYRKLFKKIPAFGFCMGHDKRGVSKAAGSLLRTL